MTPPPVIEPIARWDFRTEIQRTANPVQTTGYFGVKKGYSVSDLQFHPEAEQAVNGHIRHVGVAPFYRNPGVRGGQFRLQGGDEPSPNVEPFFHGALDGGTG